MEVAGQAEKLGPGLRNLWRWDGWLWEWRENLPKIGSTLLTGREQAQATELWAI